MRQDINAVFERDPAARSVVEVLICYPGLHAVWAHRFAHWLWGHDMKLMGRLVSHLARGLTGIEIHPGAQIASGFFIDHGMGVVIGETAIVGKNVSVYHGVTLGGTTLVKGKRHPTVEDDVTIGAGAKVLGNITVGKGSRIGANAVVVKSVPQNSVVVGVPGHVLLRNRPADPHQTMPDPVAATLAAMSARIEVLEQLLEVKSSKNGANGTNGHKKATLEYYHI